MSKAYDRVEWDFLEATMLNVKGDGVCEDDIFFVAYKW